MADIGEIVAVCVVAVLAVSVLGGLPAGSAGSSSPTNQTADVGLLNGGATIGANVLSVDRARTSLNDSIQLTGAPDSNVTIASDADLGHDFSVCTYATADASVVSGNETRILLATESAILQYNGSKDTWQGYFYNTSSRDSFRASVAASSPTSPTLVCLNHANQSLNVSANTTTGPAVATGSSNVAAYPNGSNWRGTVEETRLYATPLNGSQRAEWVADPVLALGGATPATRVTYDTRSSSTPGAFTAYFGSGTASVMNASLAVGRTGPAISQGTDYSVSGDTLTVLGGGTLDDDGEVLYVDWVRAGSDGSGLAGQLGRLALALVAFLGIALVIDRQL